MSGPPPKRNAQRRNKKLTRALLTDDKGDRVVPPLPKRTGPRGGKREWHPMTVDAWNKFWRSPVADQVYELDLVRLYMYFELIEAFWQEPSLETAKEIRLAGQPFGATPLDRLRLQWEIREPDEERVPASRLRGAKALKRGSGRDLLRAVK